MIQLDWSLLVSGVIFLITLFALNRLLFRPLSEVLAERRSRTSDLVDRASDKEDYLQELMEKYQSRIREEKQAGYRLAEEVRAETLAARQEKLKAARQEAEKLLEDSKLVVDRELRSAREELKGEAEKISELVTARILRES